MYARTRDCLFASASFLLRGLDRVPSSINVYFRTAVKNTGHSYNGASTFDGSLQINLSQMDDIIVDAENMLMTVSILHTVHFNQYQYQTALKS